MLTRIIKQVGFGTALVIVVAVFWSTGALLLLFDYLADRARLRHSLG